MNETSADSIDKALLSVDNKMENVCGVIPLNLQVFHAVRNRCRCLQPCDTTEHIVGSNFADLRHVVLLLATPTAEQD